MFVGQITDFRLNPSLKGDLPYKNVIEIEMFLKVLNIPTFFMSAISDSEANVIQILKSEIINKIHIPNTCNNIFLKVDPKVFQFTATLQKVEDNKFWMPNKWISCTWLKLTPNETE